MRGAINAPLVIDSTEYPVLEAALKLYGGKPIINSINFEDGEEAADKRLRLAQPFRRRGHRPDDRRDRHGEGGRRTSSRIAQRLYDFACNKHGLPPSRPAVRPADLYDLHRQRGRPQARPQDPRRDRARSREAMPECQIILGLSNISFGLNPPARQVLNSVFLDHALKRGLTGAIVHFSRILPLHRIPEEEVRVAEDLIFDRRARMDQWRLRPAAGVHRAVRGPHRREGREKGPARKARRAPRAAHRRRRPARARSRSRPGDGRATSRSTSSTTSCSTA